MEYRVVRRTFALLVAGLFVASLAVPAVVMGAPPWGGNVHAVSPTGTDDTTNLQNALNLCTGAGPNCTVQLKAATYYTKQLVAYDFHGTFKGAGENSTTIQALPDLTVGWTIPESASQCAPVGESNLAKRPGCLWPNLIMFVNGTIEVSDLSISEPYSGDAETTPWPTVDFGTAPGDQQTLTALYDVLAFTGQSRSDASVDRVSITGAPDGSATSFYGYNLANGIDYTGFYPNGSTGQYGATLTGSFSVPNSTFDWEYNPIAVDGPHLNNQVTIGGAPWAGNSFDNAVSGVDLESAQNSTFEVSYNTSAATHFGMWVSYDPTVPTSPSQYRIHDNNFVSSAPAGYWDDGIVLWDNSAAPYIGATIWHNTIRVLNPGNAGIEAQNATRVVILGNTVTGTGYDAIGLYGVTKSAVTFNDVSGFTLMGTDSVGDTGEPGLGLSQYYLDAGSANNLVMCLHRNDTVLDQGTGNKVIGCTPVAYHAAQVAPLVRPSPKVNPKP